MRLVGAEEKAEGVFSFGAVLHEGIDFVEIGILSVGDFFPSKMKRTILNVEKYNLGRLNFKG